MYWSESIQSVGRRVDLYSEIHKLINSIWNKEELPGQWKELIVAPVSRYDDKTGCSRY
jgi:hypothetical protein